LIDCQIENKIARITLNRPEKRNAINDQFIRDLQSALASAASNNSVAVTLITAAGPDFCAGMDIAVLRESANATALELLDSARSLGALYAAIRDHPHPVVTAVHGRALAGGCGLATACDIVLSAESAQFGYPEVGLGFVPALVMSMIRHSLSEKRAFELLVSGKPVTAREAFEIGLVTRVYSDPEFESSVAEYTAALAEKSASALALTKKLWRQIDGMPFNAALEAGAQINAVARMTEDARQGFQRFSERKIRE
jgi:methylglutaconyl-CoA hydratase